MAARGVDVTLKSKHVLKQLKCTLIHWYILEEEFKTVSCNHAYLILWVFVRGKCEFIRSTSGSISFKHLLSCDHVLLIPSKLSVSCCSI